MPDETNQFSELQVCLKTWRTCNFLLLNSDKTEDIVLGPKHLRNTLSNAIATLYGWHYPGLQHHHKESGSYL